MNTDLKNISEELENEATIAETFAEFMLILHTASYGCRETGISFFNAREAFWLMHKMSEEHAKKLDFLAERAIAVYSGKEEK